MTSENIPKLGEKSKNEQTDSSMLKSKNQVTLFVNYSYNGFCEFHSSENIWSEQGVMCQIIGFSILSYGEVWAILGHLVDN